MSRKWKLVITCEHASNAVSLKYRKKIPKQVLNSHRGIDFGAKAFAKELGRVFKLTPHLAKNSRLVVDLNRSLHNPAKLFSSYLKPLSARERDSILKLYYLPYRNKAETHIARLIKSGYRVFHLSVHSFTPVLNGKNRDNDIGLLFDPSRPSEKELALTWKKNLKALLPDLCVRFNYPYKGIADGFTTYMRKKFKNYEYSGIELEMNQKYFLTTTRDWPPLKRALIQSVKRTFKG